MRWPWERLLEEQTERSDSRALVVAAPLFLLSVFTLLVRTADSSSEFRLDQTAVLERLRIEILGQEVSSPFPDPELEIEIEALAEDSLPAVEIREVRETVRRGDTFGGFLRRLGIDPGEVTRWTAAAKEHASLASLRPGNEFTFLLPSGTPRLAGLTYELSIDSTLVMREDGEGIAARVERLPRMRDVVVAGGEIESTLYGSAVSAGIPEEVVSQFVDVFGWDVDFSSALQKGDAFRLAYEEERTTTGKRIGGRLLAAELVNGGKALQAFRYQAGGDAGKFYTPEGRPYGRAFLRYPVEFARISSQFSTSRFHPILRIHRPHYGVDFAAPRGTPVRSIGAGTIVSAGWSGGHGRFVKIRHGGGIESSYSHLHSIARGVRRGARIEMGQTVGTVGATGLATGPHLHFAMWKNGKYVNPSKIDLPPQDALEGRVRAAFERERDGFLAHLAQVKIETKPVVTVLATSPVAGG
jgi:murein DD-endopeptidase MepM/ murein hydrolase activator NlpD